MEDSKPKNQSSSGKKRNLKPAQGFDYHVSQEQIEEYSTWPYSRRLEWLLAGNRLRQALPRRILEIQDKFRRGEI